MQAHPVDGYVCSFVCRASARMMPGFVDGCGIVAR